MTKTMMILIAAALATPAMASDAQMVRYADLNLESTEGRATLERRLDRAVRSLCAVDPGFRSNFVSEDEVRCISATRASLSGKLDQAITASRASNLRTAGL